MFDRLQGEKRSGQSLLFSSCFGIQFLFLLFFSSCSSQAYLQEYSYLEKPLEQPLELGEEDFSIVFLVDARHLDYRNSSALLKSLAKNPQSRKKGQNVGHAWVYLEGVKDGKKIVLEGGHTGEWGGSIPRYFEGVSNYLHYGVLDPKKEGRKKRLEKNPIKYLWASLYDGEFQKGSGGHQPTFAAKCCLTQEQFEKILMFMDSKHYFYEDYALTRNQCSSFLAKIAALMDLELEHEVTVDIEPVVFLFGKKYRLWEDPIYSKITFSSPDILEKSLYKMVLDGKAEPALRWYKNNRLPYTSPDYRL